jgi:hypothetical protein
MGTLMIKGARPGVKSKESAEFTDRITGPAWMAGALKS